MTVYGLDILRVTANQVVNSSDAIQNVFYFQMDAGGEESDTDTRNAIAAHLDAAWLNLESKISPQCVFTNIEFYNVTQDVPMLPRAWPTPPVGTAVGAMLPLQTCPLVTFPTLTKRSTGKKYLGGFTISAITVGGQLEAGHIASLGLWKDDIMSTILIDDSVGYIGHLQKSTGNFVIWDQGFVNPIVATQRRRRIGVGE